MPSVYARLMVRIVLGKMMGMILMMVVFAKYDDENHSFWNGDDDLCMDLEDVKACFLIDDNDDDDEIDDGNDDDLDNDDDS